MNEMVILRQQPKHPPSLPHSDVRDLQACGTGHINEGAMEGTTEEPVLSEGQPKTIAGVGWQIIWFVGHLAAVYVIVTFCSPSLAGLTRKLLPLLLQRPTSSGFEFFFSHILVFSFVPAFLLSLVSDRCKHKVAQYVWLVPTVILAYKFATFAAPSVLQSQFSASFHQYFGGGFLIPEFRNQNWRDFWSIVSSNPDMTRGLAQFWFTAPFYAGVGYSLAAWIACHKVHLAQVRKNDG